MCNNNFCGGNLIWVILLAILFCGCGGNGAMGVCGNTGYVCGNGNTGCGCENTCGCC